MIEKFKSSTTPLSSQKDRPSLDSLMITKSELQVLLSCDSLEEAFEKYSGLIQSDSRNQSQADRPAD